MRDPSEIRDHSSAVLSRSTPLSAGSSRSDLRSIADIHPRYDGRTHYGTYFGAKTVPRTLSVDSSSDAGHGLVGIERVVHVLIALPVRIRNDQVVE